MSSLHARIWAQQQFAYVPHTSVSGETWQFIKAGTCTSNGAADGTTIIDSNGDSAGADAYNGLYWVHVVSGSYDGEWCRIVDDNGTGTLTLENLGFSGQVVSGVEYEIWKSPEPVVVVDSSSGETDMVDAVRSEANDYWIGYYACPITGTHRGKIARITDSVSGTGTFTLAASFGSALSAGDVVLLRKFIEVEGFDPASLEEAYNPRLGNRLNFSVGDGVVGPRGGACSFSTQITASNSLAGTGVAATDSVLAGLLPACGLVEVVGTSSTVGAGSSTTSVKVASGSGENHPIGSMVIWHGEASFVQSVADGGVGVDTINVLPAFSLIPAASDVLYATRMYRKTTDGDVLGVTLEAEIDGVRFTMTGCKGNVTLTSDPTPKLAFEYQVDHWVKQKESSPYIATAAYTTSQPVLEHERLAYLDNTATNIGGFTATVGAAVAPKTVQGAFGINGRAGFQVVNYAAVGTFKTLMSSTGTLDELLRWTARTSKDLKVVYGTHGETFAVRIPVARHIAPPKESDDNGMVAVSNEWGAHDAGTTSTTIDSSVTKIPDWALHIS
jgi:hypothetical protein